MHAACPTASAATPAHNLTPEEIQAIAIAVAELLGMEKPAREIAITSVLPAEHVLLSEMKGYSTEAQKIRTRLGELCSLHEAKLTEFYELVAKNRGHADLATAHGQGRHFRLTDDSMFVIEREGEKPDHTDIE